jgi:hypothetical protein
VVAVYLPGEIPSASYPPPTHWRDQAACNGLAIGLSTAPTRYYTAFFPERGQSTKLAKDLCADCPVQPECLDYAIDNNVGAGIWAGMSQRQRKIEAKRRGVELVDAEDS